MKLVIYTATGLYAYSKHHIKKMYPETDHRLIPGGGRSQKQREDLQNRKVNDASSLNFFCSIFSLLFIHLNPTDLTPLTPSHPHCRITSLCLPLHYHNCSPSVFPFDKINKMSQHWCLMMVTPPSQSHVFRSSLTTERWRFLWSSAPAEVVQVCIYCKQQWCSAYISL